MARPRFVTYAGLPTGPDAIRAWINLDLLTRRVVGRRLEEGSTFETNEALDALRVLTCGGGQRGAP